MHFVRDDDALSIPGRFETIISGGPHRIAIKTKDRSITYEALNQEANRIGAAILERLGPRNEPVALLFGNGIDSIAALMGTLKAGKCFIAIDPSFPLPRIRYMLRDTEARLIVTNGENLELMRELVGPGCVGITVEETRDRGCGENLGLTISPEDIATIVYTSGSTAEPKGVVKTHGYCLERADFNVDFLSVSPDDRLSLLHSVSFGSAEINLYASLLTGASLFPFDVKQAGVAGLVHWLTSEQITVFHCAPSLFRQFIESIPLERQFPSLRLLHLSGSPITRADFDQYKRRLSHGAVLAFHMGATEAGCIASAVVDRNFSFPERGTPAGFTRPQKKVLILDDNGHEMEPGEIGEIAVQSRYLAQGYWKNPELTNAKFKGVPNNASERIYLTGDFGQLTGDGFLVHMGRKDFMVKIRGYRVELGEVEKALMNHPEIKEAAVVAREREAGEFYLAAYLVLQTDSTIPIDRLAAFLRQRLPDYMIPSVFSFLDSLPLTNGKLDRRALPTPASQRPEMSMPMKRLDQRWSRRWLRFGPMSWASIR